MGRVVIVLLVCVVALLSTCVSTQASWDGGCTLTTALVHVPPLAEDLQPVVAQAEIRCATPRVRTVQVCLYSEMAPQYDGEPGCTVMTMRTRTATITATCLSHVGIGDVWTPWAWLWDPVLGTQATWGVAWLGLVWKTCDGEGVVTMT